MKNIISKRAELIITAVVFAVVAIASWFVLPEFVSSYELGLLITKYAAISLMGLAFLYLVVAFTLTRKKKLYQALKDQGDELRYEVGHAPMFRVHCVGIAAAACMAGMLLACEVAGIPLISSTTIIMAIILIVIVGFWFWAVRTTMNVNIVVGNNFIVMSTVKGKLHVFKINELKTYNKHYYRKSTNTKYTYIFPNGEFSVFQESGFFAKCLITQMNHLFERKCSRRPDSFSEGFDAVGKEYCVAVSGNHDVQVAQKEEVNWVYDKTFAKKVRSDARVAVIGTFIFALIIMGMLYGLVYVWANNNIIAVALWVVAFVCFYLWMAGAQIVRCFGKIYMLTGKVAKKYAVVKRNHISLAYHYIDVETSNGKGLLRVSCTEEVYKMLDPGDSVVRLSRAGLAKPEIYYDEDEF